MITRQSVVFVVCLALFSTTLKGQYDKKKYDKPEIVLSDEAKEIHESGMLFDGHNDLPWAMRQKANYSFEKVDISKPTDFHTDIPRLKKGGLKAQFWSVYVPATDDAIAVVQTIEQINFVHKMCETYPETFELALTADDVERIVKDGKIASLIGIEGGHSIHDSLQVLKEMFDRGARYMTLTHSTSPSWATSSRDEDNGKGLSPFGKIIVEEMNRLGMLIDLSHVSPQTMKDTFETTRAPVIFSHSSARAICDNARNVNDEMLKATADNGGVVMINFYSGYIVPMDVQDETNRKFLGNVQSLADHVDHIVKVAGIDHVGIGSDFDGVSFLPKQMEDVSMYPYLTQELLTREYTKEQIHKILGGNVLRVLRECEKVAGAMQAEDKANQEKADAEKANPKDGSEK